MSGKTKHRRNKRILHLFSFNPPIMGGFLSEKATLLCALSMRKGVKNAKKRKSVKTKKNVKGCVRGGGATISEEIQLLETEIEINNKHIETMNIQLNNLQTSLGMVSNEDSIAYFNSKIKTTHDNIDGYKSIINELNSRLALLNWLKTQAEKHRSENNYLSQDTPNASTPESVLNTNKSPDTTTRKCSSEKYKIENFTIKDKATYCDGIRVNRAVASEFHPDSKKNTGCKSEATKKYQDLQKYCNPKNE